MSVNYQGVSQTVLADSVIYSKEATVKAIAQAAMLSMAEANVDMICDTPEQFAGKADVEAMFQGLHEQAADLIRDTMHELTERLLEELSEKRYTARVTGLHYADNGSLDDVTVSVDFTSQTVDTLAV